MEGKPSPRITVAVICRNGAAHVVKFLSSVARQTFDLSKVEVVFVDDGSTDGSDYIAERFGEELPNFKLVRTGAKNGSGCGGARNAALKEATGDYIWQVDVDDFLSEDALERIDKAIESSKDKKVDAVVVTTSSVRGESARVRKDPKDAAPRALLVFGPVAAWAKVIRREVALEMKAEMTCQDMAWHFLQCEKANVVVKVDGDSPCYFYNRNSASSVTNTLEWLATNPRTIEQLAFDNALVKAGMKDRVVSDVLRALADMYDIRHSLRSPDVRAAWAARFRKVVSHVMTGRFVD